jgi:hypothetical protein
LDYNYTLWDNDGIKSYSFNVAIQTFAVFTKILGYVTIRIPETKDDETFGKEFAKIVVDLEKALAGLQNNFMVSKLVEMILKGSEQDYKFPLKKLSLSCAHSQSN